jgi:hypothetical protein
MVMLGEKIKDYQFREEQRRGAIRRFIANHQGTRPAQFDAFFVPPGLVVAKLEDVLPNASIWDSIRTYAVPLKPAEGQEAWLGVARNRRGYNKDAFYVLLFLNEGATTFLVNPSDLKKGEFSLHEQIDDSWQQEGEFNEAAYLAYVVLSGAVPCQLENFSGKPATEMPMALK